MGNIEGVNRDDFPFHLSVVADPELENREGGMQEHCVEKPHSVRFSIFVASDELSCWRKIDVETFIYAINLIHDINK